MSRRRSNVARLGTPDLVLVSDAGSDVAAPSVSYIVCINGRVPERYEVWCLNGQEVCEVHLTAQVKLFTLFYENTFRIIFYDLQRCRVPFIGRKDLKNINEKVWFRKYLKELDFETIKILK